ncbi:MAG: UvrD-helicase domain-containing protein [Bacteroidota bacterium]
MQNYLQSLNDVQRQAVTTTEGPVLVVAGPGSGKTRVLTFRIAHLIEKGAAPWEILALTFTNKAAREMKERIAKVVGDRANKVWAGTFHSIFARILRSEAHHIGYPSNFTIYDTDDSKSVLSAIIKEMNLNKEDYGVNAIRNRISSAKSKLITPKSYAADDELMSEDRQARRPHFAKVYAKYTIRCKRSGAMDFDDLLYRLYELFQNFPEVREKYQKRFKYIMVDEFQDTNMLQYEIIRKFLDYRNADGSVDQSHPRNVCVVGDDAQSIYAFRGATIENILHFEKDFKPFQIQVFKLEQNYRSTEHIVQAANELIINNRRQIQKKIWSDKGTGNKIRVIRALSDNEEGKRVADTIVEQKNRYHLSNSEIAILYRTNAQSRVFEEYLRRQNIAYRVFGGLSFYQRKEVKDLIAYLRLAVNTRDEEALRRVINYPRRGIGKSTIEKLSAQADANQQTMWECLSVANVSSRANKQLAGFKIMIEGFARLAKSTDAYEAAKSIYKKSGLQAEMTKDNSIEGMNRMENANSLLDGIKEFVENDEVIDGNEDADKSLATYLQNIALITDMDSDDGKQDTVTLMSVHAAKGLEFSSVFVVGLEEKLFPSFMSMDTPEGLDEERRLFYVAITRAENYLTLTYANSRYRFGQMKYNQPSRFLEEIAVEHIESTHSIRGGQKREVFTGAKVQGNFKMARRQAVGPKINPANFKPSPSSQIQAGMRVLHMKFGEGKVINVDGGQDNRVATIFFKSAGNSEKRIMLKFAKLQIIN